MGNSIKELLIFVTGAAIGSVVTWKLVAAKYKQIADEEIESVKEHYDNKLSVLNDIFKNDVSEADLDEEDEEFNEEDKEEYKKIADVYSSESEKSVPYVITPDEFGEFEDYDQINLTYYSDGIIIDDLTERIVEDVEELIGPNLDRIGEYEDDVLHVRNEELEVDYEILAVEDKYKEEE